MKKTTIVFLLLALIAGLFISCSQEITVDADVHNKINDIDTFCINGKYFSTLQAAVDYFKDSKAMKAPGDNDYVIYLTRNASGPGADIVDIQGLVIDFAGFTYSFTNVTAIQGETGGKFGLSITDGSEVTLKGLEQIDLFDTKADLTMVYIEGSDTSLTIEDAPKMKVEPTQYVFWAANGATLTVGSNNTTAPTTISGKIAATGGTTAESKPVVTFNNNTSVKASEFKADAAVVIVNTSSESTVDSFVASNNAVVVVSGSGDVKIESADYSDSGSYEIQNISEDAKIIVKLEGGSEKSINSGEGIIVDEGGVTPEPANYVARIGSTMYESLSSAIVEPNEGKTVLLLKDIAVDSVVLDYHISLDGGAHTITVSGVGDWSVAVYVNYGNVVGDYSIENVIFDIIGTNDYGLFIEECNALLNNCTINSYGNGVVSAGTHGNVTLNNTTITSSNQGSKSWHNTAIAVEMMGTMTVNSGIYNADCPIYVYSSGGVITINDGSFVCKENGNLLNITLDRNNYPSATSFVNIKGGSSLSGTIILDGNYSSEYENCIVTGGTFDHDPSAYVARGYYAEENTPETGWWTVDSIFDGSGTEDDPYIIDGIDAWMKLVHMCENDSTFASTNGKYFKMTSDVDVSSKTVRATVHYFAGHIDFSGYTLCGFNSNNTVPGDVGDDGIVAAFSIVSGDVSISNLVYEINSITNTQTVHNQLVGKTPYYADGVKLVFDNVTVNGLATGVSGNNHSPLFAFAYQNTNLTISCKNCTNNATIIGSGFKSAFIGNLSYVKSGSLTFENCKNNGTIISTDGKPVALLISNAGDNSANTDGVSITVANCVNNGVISTSGVSNFGLLLGSNYSSLSKAANISVNGSNWGAYLVDMTLGGQLVGSVAFITTTTIETDNGCFVLPSNSNAKYYQLHFSFSASSHAGGNVGYVVEFGNKSQQFTGDLPNDVAVSSWVDDETKVGDVSEYNITGATSGVLYKDSQGNYVFNESGSRLRDKVSVSFIAYGENNQVLSIATYQY